MSGIVNKRFWPFWALWSKPEARKRFWAKVQKGPECWLWTGARHGQGYGLLTCHGTLKAHRASFFLANGYIHLDGSVLHTCDNPSCVNPDHLRLGTQRENIADMDAKGRRKFRAQFGEENPMARLTARDVAAMRAEREKSRISYKRIAERFGVSTMTAYRAITLQSWSKA